MNFNFKAFFLVLSCSLLISCQEESLVKIKNPEKSLVRIKNPEENIREAIKDIETENYKSALKKINSSINMNPNIANSYFIRGKVFYEIGHFTKAKVDFEKALELNSELPEVHNSLGRLLLQENELPSARKSFKNAIEINPNYYNAYINLGVIDYRNGNFQQALFNFTRAIEINPNSELALKNRANTYSKLGAGDAVCEDISRLCKLSNCSQQYRNTLKQCK